MARVATFVVNLTSLQLEKHGRAFLKLAHNLDSISNSGKGGRTVDASAHYLEVQRGVILGRFNFESHSVWSAGAVLLEKMP